MHLIHHVVVVAVGAARDNFDGIGSMICLACRLHHSSKCPTAKNSKAQHLFQRPHKQPMCTVMYWTDSIALHARSCSLLDWLHAVMAMHMMSPLYPPTRVVQGIPAKELAPLHMIPVGQQDFCVCPMAQEVTPLLTGLLAVAPQLFASALIIHHLKAIHL